jgi:hypothetical protein
MARGAPRPALTLAVPACLIGLANELLSLAMFQADSIMGMAR